MPKSKHCNSDLIVRHPSGQNRHPSLRYNQQITLSWIFPFVISIVTMADGLKAKEKVSDRNIKSV